MIGIAAYGRTSAGADRTTLLYALVSGAEDHQGPLDKTAYAETNTPGVGGARLAAADSGTDSINFNDPETQIDPTTLQGAAVVAPLSPIETVQPDGSTDNNQTTAEAPKSQIYAVGDGDTVASLAAKFNISVNTILWANGLQANDIIKPGDRLIIPPTTGVLHKVKRGDTLGEIAQLYNVKAADIQEFNHLDSGQAIKINQQLMVPGAELPDPTPAPTLAHKPEGIPSSNTNIVPPAPVEDDTTVAAGPAGFHWPAPASHDISQGFMVAHTHHTGIDIDKDGGTTIVAALPGVVQFTGWLGGYGNFTIIQHANGLVTRYGHQAKFLVSPGQKVSAGQPIGIVGTTGHSTGYHLHFEVLKNGQFQNPLAYL